jgi:Ribosomal silencing factor during starvation
MTFLTCRTSLGHGRGIRRSIFLARTKNYSEAKRRTNYSTNHKTSRAAATSNINNNNDAQGITTATVSNTLTRTLIDHLKDRKLDDVGVSGARLGTNHLTPRGTAHIPRSMQSTWHIVDCGSYIVHILDVHTRNYLKPEDLWSGKDPLRQLEYLNDDAVEEYCEKHPVPMPYKYMDLPFLSFDNTSKIWYFRLYPLYNAKCQFLYG